MKCGATIFQKCPDSALFKLPALADPDVRAWMKNDFPNSWAVLRANQGSPIDLQRIQNESLRLALEEVRSLLTEQKVLLQSLNQTLARRTAVLSPAKKFSGMKYQDRFDSTHPLLQPVFSLSSSTQFQALPNDFLEPDLDETGIYIADPEPGIRGDSGLRAFVNESPKTPTNSRREKTQVDLILPPTLAFSERSA